MILLAVLLAQTDAQDSTAAERAFCSGPQNEQPERYCLADRKQARAERDLAAALAQARRVAAGQKRRITRFSRDNGGVTLAGDPVAALATSQRHWERSYRADCLAVGLAEATGSAGTEGVTAEHACRADRMLERAGFLTSTYSPGD